MEFLSQFLLYLFGNFELTSENFQNNPLLDFNQLFDYTNAKFWPYFFLLLYFAIPSLNSTMFQRILMARNTTQIKRSFSIAAVALISSFICMFYSIVGIMVMIMSTTDSWINTSSVIFSHDFCKHLGIQVKHELLISRVFSVVIGICTVFLALSATNLLKLLLLSTNFYKPIVTVP